MDSHVGSPRVLKAAGRRASTVEANSAPSLAEVPVTTGKPEGRWLYADKPLRQSDADAVDALALGAYADALALLMDWKATDTPLTIAISGPWGAGKTSLAAMAEARLRFGSDWNSDHVICKFDAWANDDATHLGAAFAAAVAKTVNRERHWWVRLRSPLPSVMLAPEQRWRRRMWLWILAFALAVIFVFWPSGDSLITAVLHPESKLSALGHGKTALRVAWPVLVVAVIAMAQKLGPGLQTAARWIDDPRSEAAHGSMQEASQQLGHFIRQSLRGRRRLIIFVDNLERCRPPRAVEVCEVVSQLIGHKDVVTVLIGDMDTVALSAEIKYAALESVSLSAAGPPIPGGRPGSAQAGSYGRAYLEKLIQIQVPLPPPQHKNLEKMLVPPASGEVRAFPSVASDPSLVTRLTRKTVARALPKQWALAVGSIGVVATIATLGTDVAIGAVGLTGAVASAAAEVWAESYRDRREEKKRKAIDKAVRSKVDPAETTLRREDAVAEELEQQNRNVDPREIRKRMRQRIISENHLRTELDRALLAVLPLSPRGAKRMFNHAHLLLDIGVERGIFTEQSGLLPGHLATWVGLTERWPSVAAAFVGDPALVGRLEHAARRAGPIGRADQLTAIQAETGISGVDYGVLDYLRRSASLAPVARLLANFSPSRSPDGARPESGDPGETPRAWRGDVRSNHRRHDADDVVTPGKQRPDLLADAMATPQADGEPDGAESIHETLYIDGLAALHTEQWDEAICAFRALSSYGHGYRDVADRLKQAQRGRRLSSLYAAAFAAAEDAHWTDATTKFGMILDIEPTYRDAQHQMEVSSLRARIASSSCAGKWHDVVSTAKHLRTLAPDEPDLDELLESAQASFQAAERYKHAVMSIDSGAWRDAWLELADLRRESGGYKGIDDLSALVLGKLSELAPDLTEADNARTIRVAARFAGRIGFSPDSSRLAISAGRRVLVMDLNGVRQFAAGRGNAAFFDQTGRRLATVDGTSGARIWDAVTGKQLLRITYQSRMQWPIPLRYKVTINDVAFGPDELLATAGMDGTARIWDTGTGEQILEFAHPDVVHHVSFSQDGRFLLTTGSDNMARIWHADTGVEAVEVSHEEQIRCAVFSPDGRTFATGDADGSVRIFNSASGTQLLAIQHERCAFEVAFSPAGQVLATVSLDGNARLWNSDTGDQLLEISSYPKIKSLSFSPDGQFLAILNQASKAELWQLTPDAAVPDSATASRSLHRRIIDYSWDYFIYNVWPF